MRQLHEEMVSAEEQIVSKDQLNEQLKDECTSMEQQLAECKEALAITMDNYEQLQLSLKELQ